MTTTIAERRDNIGRVWFVIPEDDARALRQWIDAHWREVAGVNHGSTSRVERDTPIVGPITAALYDHAQAQAATVDDHAAAQDYRWALVEGDAGLFVGFCPQRSYTAAEWFSFSG